MFEATLLDSSTARRPVLGAAEWLLSIGIGFLGFLVGAMKISTPPTPDGTKILLLRAAIVAGALMFYSLSVCYAYKDAQRQGFRAWLWAAVVIVANLPGFLIYLVYSAVKTSDWKRATLPIAYTSEVFLICLAALVPLIYTQALPNVFSLTKPVLPPSRGVGQAPRRPTQARVRSPQPNEIALPPRIPNEIRYDDDKRPLPPVEGPYVPGVPLGGGGNPGGVWIGFLSPEPGPPPAPPKPKPAETKRIVVGGKVEAARAIFTPPPEYPRLAIMTRVQGSVRIRAIIGTDGSVQQLIVVNGHPLLIPAAKDAVARWRYQPTLLNGEPVEVDTEIDVKFVLNN